VAYTNSVSDHQLLVTGNSYEPQSSMQLATATTTDSDSDWRKVTGRNQLQLLASATTNNQWKQLTRVADDSNQQKLTVTYG